MDVEYRSVAISVFLLGLLCLPAPLYLGYGAAAVGDLAQTRVDHGYYAEEGRADVLEGRERIEYESLSSAEQQAIDRIVANSSGSDYGTYAPREDNPIVDREPPFLVERNGTLYSIRQDGGTTIGLGFFGYIAGMAVAAVGVVLVLGGGIGYLVLRWQSSRE